MPMAFSHTSGAPSEPSPTRACITVRYVAPALPSFTPPSPRPITDPPTLFLFFFFLNDPPPPDSSPLPLPAPLPIFRRDVFEPAPPMLKEGAYGLGATTTEVVWQIVLPYTRVGVAGGILLGLGRALGETMAVTFVIGNSHHVHASDRKSTRLNSSHGYISYAVFCLKKKQLCRVCTAQLMLMQQQSRAGRLSGSGQYK